MEQDKTLGPLNNLLDRLLNPQQNIPIRVDPANAEKINMDLLKDLQYGQCFDLSDITNDKAKEKGEVKINTSKHKNEDNLSQDELEANSRLVSAAMSNLLQAYDALTDYKSGLGKETSKNAMRQVREAIEEAYNKLASSVSLELVACAKENYPVVHREMLGKGYVDFRDMGLNIEVAQSISDLSTKLGEISVSLNNNLPW